MNIHLICENEEKFGKIMNKEERMLFSEVIPFALFVDGVCVVRYDLILQKYNGLADGVSYAEVQYFNCFYNSDNAKEREKYVGKGFVKKGLDILTEYAFNYNVPYLHLDINMDNIASCKVAKDCGFKKFGSSFYKVHPLVKELYEQSLGEKLNPAKERIMNDLDCLLNNLEHESKTRTK